MQHTVWTPNRESSSARAFMVTLRLHSPAWHWVETAREAGWWLVDACGGDDVPAMVRHYEQAAEKPRVAFIANQLTELPRSEWTFFKRPVQSGLIFNWIAAQRPTASPGPPSLSRPTPMEKESEPWRSGLLRLQKWPNVGRYGSALELTIACSRLLATPASYEQILQWRVPADALDRLLADAHRDGLLELLPAATELPQAVAVEAEQPADPVPAANTSHERSRWDLVRRLLGKFSRA